MPITRDDGDFCRLELAIAVQTEPIQGLIVDDRGNAWPFTGWLDLVQALEMYRGRRPGDHNESRAEVSAPNDPTGSSTWPWPHPDAPPGRTPVT